MGLDTFSLQNKLALITGGGTGIGLGIAKAFISANAQVIITGRREEVLKKAVEELGDNANYIVNDISDKSNIPELISHIEHRFGVIDILVNNAGVHLKKWAQDTSDNDFENVINTNLLSVFSLTRECARKMIERKQGAIILISSMTALFGMDRVVAYGTSKTALTGLMNNLVTEYSKHHVRINAIAPGWIESDMLHKALDVDKQRKDKIVNRIAMNHFGQPEDIGNTAIFLASNASKYITGVTIPVDGGAKINF
ncbi:glucose 1-dehydrogenase [Flavivirga amylovorans]|uniref:Glucose 1-dehydrogenase n=1 Tax=Flavivirga amylovorans TaxID=870486 RepID=A0ABT8WWV3_9FLAO|nr:glucose 1-dehydrogenase [Flavivirga amylovorans]MDO5986166.1 glucose 1-dehydrogenase [Flavivirga amylovorans]